MDLNVLLSKWLMLILGDQTGKDWSAQGAFYFISHFPVYFIRLHVHKFLNLVHNAPSYVTLLYILGLSFMNILTLYFYRNQDEHLKIRNFKTLSFIGLILFGAAIITPLITIGQIWERYIYCGYFGLTILYSVIFMKFEAIEYNKLKFHLINASLISILTLFELSNLANVFYQATQ